MQTIVKFYNPLNTKVLWNHLRHLFLLYIETFWHKGFFKMESINPQKVQCRVFSC